MTHASASHGPDQGAPAAAPFSPETVASFRKDDTRAAAAIVLLMCGIFTIGLFLYLGVCYSILH
jgi:hypothetical protein